MKTIETRVLDSLQPHPRNASLYGNEHGTYDDKLVESLVAGIWPGEIQITTGNVIISGHRRCEHAIFASIESAEVWVRTDLPEDPTSPQVLEALLQANLQRNKGNEQKLREFGLWKEVEKELAKGRRGANQYTKEDPGAKHREAKTGDARDLAAKRVGLGSGSDAEKAYKALVAADQAEASGDAVQVAKAKEVKKALEKGIKPATRKAKEVGLIETSQAKPTTKAPPAPPAAPSRLPKRPAHLKATLERETPYIKDRLLVAAQLLVEAHTIVKSESKRLRDKFTKDNLVWTTHFQEVVEFWNEAEIFGDFDALFEVDTIKTYDDALRAISQIAKRTGERVQGIRISTGCAPDPNKAHMVTSKA